MTVRINQTTDRGESATWSPSADEIIQIDGTGERKAIVEVHARLNEDAPFAYVTSASVARDAFISVLKMPFVKLVWHSNKAGDQLKAWSL
jgi:hypothetical protein